MSPEFSNLVSLGLHPGHQNIQFSLQIIPHSGVHRVMDLFTQLLVLTGKTNPSDYVKTNRYILLATCSHKFQSWNLAVFYGTGPSYRDHSACQRKNLATKWEHSERFNVRGFRIRFRPPMGCHMAKPLWGDQPPEALAIWLFDRPKMIHEMNGCQTPTPISVQLFSPDIYWSQGWPNFILKLASQLANWLRKMIPELLSVLCSELESS